MTGGLLTAYDFMAPRQIAFGWGRRVEVGRLVRPLGDRAFLVSGSRTLARQGVLRELASSLRAAGVDTFDVGEVHREPLVEDVDAVAARVREHGVRRHDLVVGVGGGAALDLAKAVCAMATNQASSSVKDYLEGVGRGLELKEAPLPLVAIPTTAGTGSEATKNAVISSREPAFKKSLRDDRLVPSLALIDPELSVSVPADTTAYTGMDAITQLIESYLSRRARPVPQALALQGLELAAGAIEQAVCNGADREAREAMAHAALLSGMALANSGLGLAHGVAAALGIHCDVPHGLACAVMLPVALRANRDVRLREMAALAEPLSGRKFESPAEGADEVLRRVEELGSALKIPRRLRDIGVRREQIPQIVVGSSGNSMSGNPRTLDGTELTRLLEENF